MDEAIIKNWNSVVKNGDLVFHLGDVALGKGSRERIERIVPTLNGDKILIKGNHDGYSNDFYLSAGFKTVYDYPIVYDNFFILSHEPMFVTENMPYVNIHGHIHNQDSSTKSHFNASIEMTEYKPIELEVIKKLFVEVE